MLLKFRIINNVFTDFIAGVNDRGMIPVAELFSDFRGGQSGKFTAEIHTDESRLNNPAVPAFRFKFPVLLLIGHGEFAEVIALGLQAGDDALERVFRQFLGPTQYPTVLPGGMADYRVLVVRSQVNDPIVPASELSNRPARSSP